MMLSAVPDDLEDTRPAIRVGSELHETCDEAVAALAADSTVYQRAGMLVHVTRTPGEAPIIRQVSAANLRERLSAYARWERASTKKLGVWERCLPPDNVVQAVLDPGRAGARVRNLIGILEAPSLRPDGTAIEEPGYDTATGYLYEPEIAFPRVPRTLSQEIARRALGALLEPFADFPFRGDSDRTAIVAALLTMIGRPAIAGATPAFIVDASTPGSGKTMIADVVAIIATGRTAPRMTFSDDLEEVAKNLAACALQGERALMFDNIAVPFGGGPIDLVLTAEDAVKMRILGRSETPDMRWRAVMMGTGNNVTWRGDTFRRVLVPRLEPTVENPEERTGFRHEDLRSWVRSQRPRLVCAAMTLLRAFVEAGAPQGAGKLWGSFESWSKLVPAAIVWAGGADPMGCRPAADDDSRDEERASVGMLLGAVLRLAPQNGITARGLIDVLYTSDVMRGEAPPDGWEDTREAIDGLTRTPTGKRPDAAKLALVCRKWRRRVVDGRKLEAVKGHGGVARWFVVPAGLT